MILKDRMENWICRISFTLVLLLLVVTARAAPISAIANGTWSTKSTWSTGTIPTSSDAVTIGTGFTVSMSSASLAGSLTGSGTISCTKSSSLSIGGDNTSTTFGGNLGGTRTLSIIKTGTGTLTLSGTNTYKGITTINGGILQLGSTSALGSTAGGTIISNGTVLDLNGFTLSTTEKLSINGTGISGGGALINNSSTAASFSGAITLITNSCITANYGAITLTGALSGSFILTLDGTVGGIVKGVISAKNVTKAGSGMWTFSGTNTYTGVTTINAGVLSVASIGNGVTVGNLGAASNLASNLVLGGGTLQYSGITASTDRAFTLTAGTTSAINISSSSSTLTLTGASANTSGSLIKAGNGTLTLSAANLYTGTTTVNTGTLAYGINNALSTGPVTVNGTTAIVSMATYSDAVGTVTVDNGGIITGTSGILTSTGTFEMKSGSVSAILAGSGIALNKTTDGTVTLSGTNIFSGVTTISAGTLIAGTNAPSGSAGALGNASSAIILGNAATSTNNSSPALLTGGAFTIARTVTIASQATTGFYSIGGNADAASTFSGAISISQPLSVTQVATSGINTLNITGGVSSGTLCSGIQILTFNIAGTVTVATAAISNGTCTIAVIKQNSGTLSMNVANTYSGGTTLITGAININNTNGLGNAAGTFVINGGAIDNTSGGAITTVNYPQTWGGDFTFTGTNNLNLGTGAVTLSGNRQVTVSANTLTVGGTISGASYNLTKAGTGTLAMGTNTVTLNGLTINSGILTAPSGNMNIAGTFSNNATFTHNNGTVLFNGSSSQTISGSSGTVFNSLTLNNAAGLSIATSPVINGTLTFSNGKITTGTNNVTLGSASTTSGAGISRYIYGNEIINIPNTTSPSRTFDIGDAGNYTPISLAFTGTPSTGTITANTTSGQHPIISTSGINYSKDAARYYTLTNNGVTGFTGFSPTFAFVSGDVTGSAGTGNFAIKRYSAGWTGTTNGTRTATTTQATGVTAFGDFAIGELQTLDHFTFILASPQGSASPFINTNTLKALDISGNIYTLFNASTDSVTISVNLPLTGTISGLSGGSKLKSASDFVSGVANLTALHLMFNGNEGAGTFTATSSTTKTGTSGIVFIDKGTLIFSTIPTQTAGTGFAVTVTVKDNLGNPVNATSDTPVSLSLASGSGTLGGILGGTMLAGSSSVTISGVTYSKVESGVSLLCHQTSDTPVFVDGTSNTFTVNAGVATHLAISAITSPKTAGAGFNIIVKSLDANNNLANVTSSTNISLSVATGTGNLSGGTTSGTFTNGADSVTISGVKYNVAESGVSIMAVQTSGSPAMTTGTSNIFLVVPDPNQSTLTPVSSGIIANGTGTQVLSVQAKDATGNNLAKGGSVVTITKLSGTGTIGSVTDNGNGIYTATVTSPTLTGSGVFAANLNGNPVKSGSGSQTQATVSYVTGPPAAVKSTLSPALASIADDGAATQTLTVRAIDANGNLLTTGGATVTITRSSGAGNISGVTDTGNGTYTATVSSTVGGTGIFAATIGGSPVMGGTGSLSTSTITFTLGVENAAVSTLTPVSSTITAGGVSTQMLTMQAKDATGNNLKTGGATVIISKSGTGNGTIDSVTDNNNGTYTATVTSGTSLGTNNVFVATLNGNPVKNGTGIQTQATVYYGSSSTQSTLTPTAASITGINTETIDLTVQAKDINGNVVTTGGETVTIARQSGTGAISVVTDNGDGSYTATVTAPNNTGSGTFVATLNGLTVNNSGSSQQTAVIIYASTTPNAAKSALTPLSASITADGISIVGVTVQANDVNGNNLSTGGATVTITRSSGTGIISAVSDNTDGTYTATVTAPTSAGIGVFAATLNSSPVQTGGSSQTQATITYTAMPADASKSTLTPTTSGISCGNTQVLTVQVKNALGNNITSGGATVVFALQSGSGSISSVIDNNNGTYNATVSSPSSTFNGTAVYMATLNGSPVMSGSGSQTSATIFINFSRTFYNKASGAGALDNLNNWGSNSDGTGTTPCSFTVNGQTFYIYNGTTATIGAAWTVSGIGSKIVVGDAINAVNFTVPASYALSTPAIDVSNNATLIILHAAVPALGTLNAGSTVVYGYQGGSQNIPAANYGNAILNGGTTTFTFLGNCQVAGNLTWTSGTVNAGPNTFFVAGNWTNNGAVFLASTSTLYLNGSTLQTIGGSSPSLLSNFVLSNSAGATLTQSQTILGTLNLASGKLTIGANTLTLAGNSLTQASGVIDASNTGSTIAFTNTSALTLPASLFAGAFNNLTINGTGGITAGDNLTLNGVLYLQSANPSATKGSLDMGLSYTLTMGANATTTGAGDVTGLVSRSSFTPNTKYSFGNQFTTLNFAPAATLPASMTVKLIIGSYPLWNGSITNQGYISNTIQRFYDIIQYGTPTGKVTVNLHYLVGELNGITESNLVVWDHHVDEGVTEQHGKSNQSTTEHWIELANIEAGYLYGPAGTHTWSLANNTIPYCTWLGKDTDWNDTQNWSSGNVPTSADDVLIPKYGTGGTLYAPTLPISTDLAPASIRSLTIQSSGIVNDGGGSTLTIIGGTGPDIGTNCWSNLGTFNAGTSTVIFTNSAATMSGTNNFYNMTIAVGANLKPGTNNYMSISNILAIIGTLSGNGSPNTIEFNGSGSQTIPNAGYYNLTLNGSSGTKTMAASTTTIAGNWTNNISGPSIFNASTSTINFNGTAVQNIGGSVAPTSFNNLTISNKAALVTSNVNINCSGNFSNSGMLDMNANILAVTGTLFNSGIIKTAVPTTTSTNPIPTGKSWEGTIEYSALNGSQTIVAGTYTNLSLDNTSGSNTAGGKITVNSGTITTTAGGTLDMGTTSTLSGTGTFTNNGTIKTSVLASTSSAPLPSGVTWNGTVEYGATTGSQTIVGGTFTNLTLDNTSGTNTASGNIIVNTGTMTLKTGGTFDLGTSSILAGSGIFTNNGTIIISVPSSTNTTPIPSGKTWSGTIEYGATGGLQTVVAGTYTDLTLDNTGGTNAIGGVITVNGAFTGSGGTLTTSDDINFKGTTTCGETLNAIAGIVTYGSSAVNIVTGTYNNLTISGSPVTFCGPVTVAGIFSPSGTINLSDNFTISGPVACGSAYINATAGTVEYALTSGSQNIYNGYYNNLKLDNTSGTNTACGNLAVNGTLTTKSGGKLDMVTYQLLGTLSTITNNGIIQTQNTGSTPIPTAKTWGGTIDYNASSVQTAEGTYNNLTIENTGGVSAANNITVNGILNLCDNPSASKGSLDMGANTLTMGATATTTGIGDVTGIVKRTTLVADIAYTFGNQFTIVKFIPGGTLPTDVSIKINIGTAPAWKPGAIQRYYDLIRTGGTGSKFTLSFHYLHSELNGNTENIQNLWHRHVMEADTEEHGRSNYNTTDNWVELSNISINVFNLTFGQFEWTLADKVAVSKAWEGTFDTDWMNSANWIGGIPGPGDDVVIPDAGLTKYDPTLPASTTINTLALQAGAILNSGVSSSLAISGGSAAWINILGTFNPGTSTVIFTNPAATMAGITNFYDVTVANGASLSFGTNNIMRIAGTLTLSGVLSASNDHNKVEYNGTNQTVVIPNGSPAGYHDLTLSGSGTKTLPSTAMNMDGDFTMSGTASATAGAALTVVGNVTLDTGTAFNASSFTHNMKGNWTNNTSNTATFNPSTSIINFNGTVAQTIGGEVSSVFNNLTVNNASGVTLGIDETVGGTLTLTSGLITTVSNTLTVTEAGTITGGNSSSYIDGKLAQAYSTTGSKVFPIGKGGNYRPIKLNYIALTGTSTVTAGQMEELLPGTLPGNTTMFRNRYWHITETGGSGYSCFLTLDGTGWSPTGTAKMIKGDGVSNIGYDVSGSNYTNATAFTDFGNFGLGEAGISWKGSTDNNWFTATNWSSVSVPKGTDNITIPSSLTYYPVINGTSPDNNVTITNTGKLQIQDGATLTLEKGPVLIFASGATVITGTGSKIILRSDAVYLNLCSSTPILEMQRQLTGTKGWRMVASPLATAYSDMFKSPLVTQGFMGSTYPAWQPNLMWWDETDPGTTLQSWREPSNITQSIAGGSGYFQYLFNGAGITVGGMYTDMLPQTMSVTGVENYNGSSGSYNYNLTYTARKAPTTGTNYYDVNALNQGWNLIGNPTASTLDWDAPYVWTKTNADNTIYVWDPSALNGNGDYLTWNGTTGTLVNGKIPPFQAFWVHATAATTLSFTNAAKTGNAGTFMRSQAVRADGAVNIPLTLSGHQMQTTSLISFTNNGLVGPDSWDGYRLEPMSDTWIELYTLSSPNHVSPLVINNLPLQDTSMVNIPLFVSGQADGTGISDTYTLKWEIPANWPPEWNISLQDNQVSKVISMTGNTHYTFKYTTQTIKSAVNSSMYTPRELVKHFSKTSQSISSTPPFSIIISKGGKAVDYLASKPHLLPNHPNPFSDGTVLRFSLPEQAQVRIEVYNLRGILLETLANSTYPAGFTEIHWQPLTRLPGMYFIRFMCSDTVETGKVIYEN